MVVADVALARRAHLHRDHLAREVLGRIDLHPRLERGGNTRVVVGNRESDAARPLRGLGHGGDQQIHPLGSERGDDAGEVDLLPLDLDAHTPGEFLA